MGVCEARLLLLIPKVLPRLNDLGKEKQVRVGGIFNSKQIDSTLKLYRFPRVYLYGPRESFVGCLALALVL
jgi:hypothetical protein